jgi:hypothetical protein
MVVIRSVMFLGVFAFAACFWSKSADSDQMIVGGNCSYKNIPGRARFLSLDSISDSATRTVVLRIGFDFSPTSQAAKQAYLFPDWPDASRILQVRIPADSVQAYLDQNGIRIGEDAAWQRMEATSGTCTPVLFSEP